MSVKKGTAVEGVVPQLGAISGAQLPMESLNAAQWREKAEEIENEGEDAEAAVAAYKKALELDPADNVARFQAAQMLLFDLTEPLEGLKLLEATPMSSWNSDLMYLRARCLADLGRQQEGIGFYERALAIMKPDEYPRNSRSEIYSSWSLDLRDLKRVAEALPIAERAAAMDQTYAHAWECLGYFQFLAGDIDTALQSLALAVALAQEMKDSLEADPDFGDFRKDARFVAMLATKELTPGARELVPTLWPKGQGAHEALPVFLAAVKRYVKPG